MKRVLIVAIRMALLTLLATGVAYPLAVTGVAALLFPRQAQGSILTVDGAPVGSSLIGQAFASDSYFHSRPSAAGADGYDATASSASNLGPTSQALFDAVESRVATTVAENPGARRGAIPVDLVTASGSGLDPHISPDAAYLQVARVVRARNLSPAAVRDLVARHTAGRDLGFLGEPRVNVLELNIALDALSSK